jgi:chemotaxis regulatin CheY-phosphate phosphatase CheZ
LSRRKSKKIAGVTGFGLNSRKSLRKANSLLRYFRAFWLQSGIIEKVVGFLSFIENELLRLLISAGMKIKEKEAYPDKDAEQIISEAEARADIALKGPQDATSQADIDKLLSDLGL